MGLDMFLSKRSYVQNWDHNPKEKHYDIKIKLGGKPYAGINPKRITHIIEEFAYWRKFNALHIWFVDNVQNGVDNCGEYHVDHTDMEKLLQTLEEVLANRDVLVDNEAHTKAKELLPTSSGFFFGGTEYDDYYYEQVEYTIGVLKEALADVGTGTYFYSSSW